MKRMRYVSMAAAPLILALLSAHVGKTTAVVATVGGPVPDVMPADPSMSLNQASQLIKEGFMWVNVNEENRFPGYKRVIGGQHDDGTTLYICQHTIKGDPTPGKLHKDLCQVPWGGKENVFSNGDYKVLLTNTQYHWDEIEDPKRVNIASSAVQVGFDYSARSNLFICRKRLGDGVHPGKFLDARDKCYISWGGLELIQDYKFEVLFSGTNRPRPR